MKGSKKIVLENILFTSIKEQLCLTKGHLGNPEGHIPPHLQLYLLSF